MNTPTDWVSAVAILASGLILGALFVAWMSRRKATSRAAAIDGDLVLRDLEAKRDSLVTQLREVEEDPRLTTEQREEERARLERETADVLRRIDGIAPQRPRAATTAATAAAAATVPSRGIDPTVKGFIWGAGTVAALAGIGWFVMQSAKPKETDATVGAPMAMQQQAAQPTTDPVVQQLEKAVAADPNNLSLRDDLAQAYLEHDNMMAVFEQTKFVLEKSPDDSRALTFQGLVRMAMGDASSAMQMIGKATKSDPTNLDSWVALAWINVQQGKTKEAEANIASAIKASPKDKARLEAVFEQMKQRASEPQAPMQTAQGGGELPPGHPPVEGGAAPAMGGAAPMAGGAMPAPAAGGPTVQIALDLAPGAASKTGVLYVYARNPMGGPPYAVKRIDSPTFPLTITLSSADSMMGQQLPNSFRIEARLDSDGNVATKAPTDPSAMQDNVAPGASVKLALK